MATSINTHLKAMKKRIAVLKDEMEHGRNESFRAQSKLIHDRIQARLDALTDDLVAGITLKEPNEFQT